MERRHELIREVSIETDDDDTIDDEDEDGYNLSQEDWKEFSDKLTQQNLDEVNEDDDGDDDSEHCVSTQPPNETLDWTDAFFESRKRQTQTTLTQMEVLQEEPKRPKRNDPLSSFEDTEEKVYDMNRKNEIQPFQIGEHYTIRAKGYSDCVFTIHEFDTKGFHKKAIGTVHQKFRSTWAHVDNSEHNFQRFLRRANRLQQRYIRYHEAIPIQLRHLGDLVLDFTPPSDPMVYHQHVGKTDINGAPGHRFQISYTRCLRPTAQSPDSSSPDSSSLTTESPPPQPSSPRPVVSLSSSRNTNHPTQPPKSTSGKPKVLDVFAGIGGMSQGFIKSGGFHVGWAVEKNPAAAATHRINHPDTFLFVECVKDWFDKVVRTNEGTLLTERNRWDPYRRVLMETDHLNLSPPDTFFSSKNKDKKNDEANANLTLFCIEIVKYFFQHRMTSVSMENVPGFLMYHDVYLKTFASALIAIGMDVQIQVLNSSRYGDPQKSSRVFLTAFKMNLREIIFPTETHGVSCYNYKKIVTASDALDDLSGLKPTEGNGFVEKPGPNGTFTYIKHHHRDGTEVKPSSRSSKLQMLKRHEPANAVPRRNNVLHYNKDLNRLVTVRELGRLQSFDDNFEFSGKRRQQIKGIGNAVPVQTATAFARAVLQCCTDPSLVVKRRVRIVSEKATIRREYLMRDDDADIIGKLNISACREFVATKWLLSPDTGMRIKRYQIKLLLQDFGKDMVGEVALGWISGRSRLEDQPYLIAKEI